MFLETVYETGSMYVCNSRVNCSKWNQMAGPITTNFLLFPTDYHYYTRSEHCVLHGTNRDMILSFF